VEGFSVSRKKTKYQKSRAQPTAKSAPTTKPQWSGFKTFFLSILSGLLIAIIFLLPHNRNWLKNKISKNYRDFKEQVQNMDLDYRKGHKWGGEYTVAKILNEVLDSTTILLVPPQTYLIEHMFNDKNTQFHIWTYPSLLYYQVDYINLVDLHSPDSLLEKATHTVWVRELNGTNEMVVDVLSTNPSLDEVLKVFRKYKLQVLFDPMSAQAWLDSRKDADTR